jgi:CRISPR-associated protein Cmr3
MDVVTIVLEPLDTLFFRNHKPFAAGEDTHAESTTMPSPLTIYGAIGDYYLKKTGKGISDLRNNPDTKLGKYDPDLIHSNLKIKGIFLTKGGRFYLPSPANIYGYGISGESMNLQILVPGELSGRKWDIDNHDIQPLAIPSIKGTKQVDGFMEMGDIRDYLLNNLSQRSRRIHNMGEFFASENRYGNTLLRDSLTVENLYSASHLRSVEGMEGKEYIKAGIAVEVEGLDKSDFDRPTLLIGGERRRARIMNDVSIQSLKDDNVLKAIQEKKRFLLYFLTPSIFTTGCYWSNLPQELDGAKLVGATINKPIYLSGWRRENDASGVPRPLRKAIPAGSVFFFTADEWDDSRFEQLYNKYNMGDSLSEEYPVAGFGITAIGVWDYK